MLSIAQAAEIIRRYGGKVASRGRDYVKFHAPHRTDREASLSVFVSEDGGIIVKDHATGEAWSLYRYLVEVLRVSPEEARRELGLENYAPTRAPKKRSPLVQVKPVEVSFAEVRPPTEEEEARATELWAESVARLDMYDKLGGYAKERGFTRALMSKAGLGLSEDGGIVIPSFDSEGRLKNLKVRHKDGERSRYSYAISGAGQGYYLSPGVFGNEKGMVVVVEGELNAAALYAVLDLPTIGIPGASFGLSRELAEKLLEMRKLIVIWTDPDEAGIGLARKLIYQLLAVGVPRDMILIPKEEQFHRDAADLLKMGGPKLLSKVVQKNFFGAKRLLKRVGSVKRFLALEAASMGATSKRLAGNLNGFTVTRKLLGIFSPDDDALVKEAHELVRRVVGQRRTALVGRIMTSLPPASWKELVRVASGEKPRNREAIARAAKVMGPDAVRKELVDGRWRYVVDLEGVVAWLKRMVILLAEEVHQSLATFRRKIGEEWRKFKALFSWAAPFVKRQVSAPLRT